MSLAELEKKLPVCCGVLLAATILLAIGCDRRASIGRSRPKPSFTADVSVVRDLSQGRNLVDIQFKRNGQPFPDAVISLGEQPIPWVGGARYLAEGAGLALPPGLNQLTFSSLADSYSRTINFNFPDSFAITSVAPRYNQGGGEVWIGWSQAAGATEYVLVVVSQNYGSNGTSPFMLTLTADFNSYLLPDTTFEDSVGIVISDVYDVYLVAFNEGFGEFDGIQFPLPGELPQKRLTDPSGFMRYGIVAPRDSIIVPF